MDGLALAADLKIPRVTAQWRNTRQTLGDLVTGLDALQLATIVVFATPQADLDGLTAGLKSHFPNVQVVASTTAGEIGQGGYLENAVVAVGFPTATFCIEPVIVQDLSDLNTADLSKDILAARNRTAALRPELENEFAILLVDGLSEMEDLLVNALTPALGPLPMFGGSAGDALEFKQTRLSFDGKSHSNAAIVLLVRTSYAVKIFRFDNFEPTSTRMVVTSADPEARIVHEINGESAAREYARLVGKNPDALSTFIFAANPVVVKVGGEFHVRSIQRVEPNGHLKFFSAIDEGLVLTVAEGVNMADHLSQSLSALNEAETPVALIGCDCVLRRLDAEQSQQTTAVSRILDQHSVIGFSTYGEQYNGLHVNQTFTGVALYENTRRQNR
jgi:hypothetical protein